MKNKQGSGGRIRISGSHTLSGMLVDFVKRDADGSVWVRFTETRGAYKRGEEYHVSDVEYEELWQGTV